MFMYIRTQRTACAVTAILILLNVPSSPAFAWNYFIAEQTDFTGHGCEAPDVNMITYSLDTFLEDDGHIGDRFLHDLVKPQWFRESCSTTYGTGGTDHIYGDNDLLTVYAGHGDLGRLWFANINNGICVADLGSHMRIGSMGGGFAGHAMWLTSCTLNTAHIASDANFQWVRQQYGFHNSPSIENGDPGRVYFWTTGANFDYSNTYAWTGIMELDSSDDEENSPIVISYNSTSSGATLVRDNAQMRDGVYMSRRINAPVCQAGQPAFYYNYVMRNNGGCP